MEWIKRFLGSTLGMKYIMSITGFLMFGFLVSHLAGNLLIFAGPEALEKYARGLRDLGPLLWVARIGLIAILLLHIRTAIKLTKRNKKARPVAYAKKVDQVSGTASRSMVLTGMSMTVFIIYHLAHYTLHWTNPEYKEYAANFDVYGMVVSGFSIWYIAVIYLIAMVVLAMHLVHGMSSFSQTLGLNHVKYNGFLRALGPVVAIAVAGGFATIPLAVMFGFVR